MRARYIWVVFTLDGLLLAAFTVKYELVNYLSSNQPGVRRLLLVQRVDCRTWPQRITDLDPKTLEPAI